jgi:DNA-binding winged helix-turn-helix (wHTH) protein
LAAPTRFRFAGFVVSRRQRQVLRDGRVLPLIPRYFDLLVLLIEQRQTAVSRREIFDRVWGDVVVSDGSLSQAVRTLRRVLEDDSREPIFIRTVSRHGYCFVFPDVVEEADDAAPAPALPPAAPPASAPMDALVDRLVRPSAGDEEDQRDAAERLHELGTAAAADRVIAQAAHARALAVLRDARWDVPGAGPVPLVGQPGGLAAALALIGLRARRTHRIVRKRCAAAAAMASGIGVLAGALGGLALSLVPGSPAPVSAVMVLALFGAGAGYVGALGVAGGVSAAEALARSWRGSAIVAGGATGGFAVGLAVSIAVGLTLERLFGLQMDVVSGPIEGLVLGAATGLGYSAATSRWDGGMATPVGRARFRAVLAAGLCCAAAGALLAAAGRPLVAGMINAIAQQSMGSRMALTPLGYIVGEPSFGPATRMLIAALESACFGAALTWGLTRRRRTDFMT